MIRILAAGLAPALLLAPAAAQDVTKAYVQVHGGVFAPTADEFSVPLVTTGGGDERASFDLDPDLGYAVGGLVGYEVARGLSVEAEVTYRSYGIGGIDGADADFGDVEAAAFLLNGVYTLTVPLLAAPYVGAGAGYITPLGDTDEFEGGFAWQVKAGVAWPVGVGRIVTEASYLDAATLDEDSFGGELDYGGVTGLIGYRFAF